MSMQIHNDGIAGPAGSQSSPSVTTAQPDQSTRIGFGANTGGDQVEISSLSANIAATAATLADQQAARVNHLAAVYARGEYQADSMQVSRALIGGAVAGASPEGDC